MIDNEIIKALECCLKGCNAEGCDDCPLYEKVEDCEIEIPIIALDLINRQKAEIERLKEVNAGLALGLLYNVVNNDPVLRKEITAVAKSEAIREFAEKMKSTLSRLEANLSNSAYKYVPLVIDNLVKEMTEENENNG